MSKWAKNGPRAQGSAWLRPKAFTSYASGYPCTVRSYAPMYPYMPVGYQMMSHNLTKKEVCEPQAPKRAHIETKGDITNLDTQHLEIENGNDIL